MTMTDEQLREALAPLREEEPSEAEVRAVLAAGSAPAPRPLRRRLWPGGVAVAVATACGAFALALLPGSSDRPLSGVGAPSILLAAAAVAAEQPAPAESGRYRYVEWLERWSYPGRTTPPGVGDARFEQRVETWVDERYEGREVRHQGRLLSGDAAAAEGSPFYEPSDGPYITGDGPRTQLSSLPTEPEALRRVLVDEYKNEVNWAPGLPTAAQTHYDVTRKVLYLLGQASDPALRAALFELLAATPGVEPAPDVRDPLGRTGRAVAIPTRPDGGGGTITVIFDTETSELLSWSEVGTGGGTPDQSHTIRDAGQVATTGARPDGGAR